MKKAVCLMAVTTFMFSLTACGMRSMEDLESYSTEAEIQESETGGQGTEPLETETSGEEYQPSLTSGIDPFDCLDEPITELRFGDCVVDYNGNPNGSLSIVAGVNDQGVTLVGVNLIDSDVSEGYLWTGKNGETATLDVFYRDGILYGRYSRLYEEGGAYHTITGPLKSDNLTYITIEGADKEQNNEYYVTPKPGTVAQFKIKGISTDEDDNRFIYLILEHDGEILDYTRVHHITDVNIQKEDGVYRNIKKLKQDLSEAWDA